MTPATKLSPKYSRPFPIVAKVGKVAYKLQLPKRVLIHPIFYVSLLKKSVGPTDLTSLDLPPYCRRLNNKCAAPSVAGKEVDLPKFSTVNQCC